MKNYKKKKIQLSLIYFVPVFILVVALAMAYIFYSSEGENKDEIISESSLLMSDTFVYEGGGYIQNSPLEEQDMTFGNDQEGYLEGLPRAKNKSFGAAEEFAFDPDVEIQMEPQINHKMRADIAELRLASPDNYPKEENSPKKVTLEKVIYFGIFILVVFGSLAYYFAAWVLKPIVKNQKDQKIFIDNASHELRTPLALLRTELDLFNKKNPVLDEKLQKFVTNMDTSSQQMEEIVKQLVLYTRLGLPNSKKEASVFSLTDLVSRSVSSFETKALESNVLIDHLLADVEVYFSKTDMQQLIFILLDNAIKYNHSGGQILVKIIDQGSLNVLRIMNTGELIPEEDLDKIQQRFYRSSKSRNSPGLGLGLSIAHDIAEKNSAKIKIYNEGQYVVTDVLLKK